MPPQTERQGNELRAAMEIDAAIYRSPKRKRGQVSHGPSIVTSGLSQTLSSTTHDSTEDLGSHSPSTRVTGKFQKLDLRSPIDLPPSLINNTNYSLSLEEQPEAVETKKTDSSSPSQDFKPPESAAFNFEPSTNYGLGLTSTAPTSQSSRVRSPPPSSVVSDQFWQASEITGWSPGDPDEDNYGVNGVGYAKTASKAWAISQKRKQQIADYRSRETRDARQRRHERRLSGFNSRRGSPRGSPRPVSRGGNEITESANSPPERKEVRFVQFGDG